VHAVPEYLVAKEVPGNAFADEAAVEVGKHGEHGFDLATPDEIA
jgi:hypothetical protein